MAGRTVVSASEGLRARSAHPWMNRALGWVELSVDHVEFVVRRSGDVLAGLRYDRGGRFVEARRVPLKAGAFLLVAIGGEPEAGLC